MSAIAFDWVRAGRQAKTEPPANPGEGCSRQEEFRLAVDKSIDSYPRARGCSAEAIDRPADAGSIASGFLGSLRDQIRRRFDAIRELWLFSREVSPDWRLPSPPPRQTTLSSSRGRYQEIVRELETYSRASLLKPELQLPRSSVSASAATGECPAPSDSVDTFPG